MTRLLETLEKMLKPLSVIALLVAILEGLFIVFRTPLKIDYVIFWVAILVVGVIVLIYLWKIFANQYPADEDDDDELY